MLQLPLAAVIPQTDMEAALATFDDHFYNTYGQLMLNKLGFDVLPEPQTDAIVGETIQFLKDSQVGYHAFFAELAQHFNSSWRDDIEQIFSSASFLETDEQRLLLDKWRQTYHHVLQSLSAVELENIAKRLRHHNPQTELLRPVIEEVWDAIAQDNNWQPFNDLVKRLQAKE